MKDTPAPTSRSSSMEKPTLRAMAVRRVLTVLNAAFFFSVCDVFEKIFYAPS